ncbi:MAG: S8 family peptidase [Egibacteraceae bacterium]
MIRRTDRRRVRSSATLLCAVLLAVMSPAASASASASARRRAVPGSLLVTTADRQGVGAVRLLASTGTSAALAGAAMTPIADRVTEVRVPAEQAAAAAQALASQPGVVAVEPNAIRHLLAVPDDRQYAKQWAHRLTGIEAGWSVATGSHRVTVAVIDSGVVASHPDLAGRIVGQVDASTGKIRRGRTNNDSCRIGHGTWVSGVIGAIGDNRKDVAGINWNVSILDISVTSPAAVCGEITDSAEIAAIDYAVTHGAKVVNLSFGGAAITDPSCPKALQATLDHARSAGVLVVAAAGNDARSVAAVPASCNGVMSVAAVGSEGLRAGYSTTNAFIDVAAPGGEGSPDHDPAVDVLTTSYWKAGARTKRTLAVAGTSFSSPYVAGLAALLLSVKRSLTPDQLESVIERTARDAGTPGRDPLYGWGVVQAGDAVALIDSGQPIPPPEQDPPFPVGD